MVQPLKTISMGTVAAEPVRWLWRPYVPLGKLTLVMGDPEAGKSWLTLALASAVSRGGEMYGVNVPKGKVLLLSAEDGLADTIRPRLDMLGADPDQVIAVEEAFELNDNGLEQLAVTMGRVRPKLVIIDPIIAYSGPKLNTNAAPQVRHLMKHLKDLAEISGAAVVMVIHMRKERNGSAMLAVQGSMDFIGASRSVIMVGRDGECRVMAHAKCSVAARGASLVYDVKDGRFVWIGETTAGADDLAGQMEDRDERQDRQSAKGIVMELLSDGEWHASAELIALAQESGVPERTLKRARAALGVQVEQRADGWFCRLPK